MCNIDTFLLQYNQYNYLSQILYNLDIMNYRPNNYMHLHNILQSRLKYKLIKFVYSIDNLLMLDNQYNYLYQTLNKSYTKNHTLNKCSHQHNILESILLYKLIGLMCNINNFLLQDNQYNYLSQILYNSNIMNYMLNKCSHQCNILMNRLMYKLTILKYNMGKNQLNHMLNKSYLIQNK